MPSAPLYPILLWFHHRLIVIAQIGDRAFIAVWSVINTNALPVSQQSFMEIVDDPGILGE